MRSYRKAFFLGWSKTLSLSARWPESGGAPEGLPQSNTRPLPRRILQTHRFRAALSVRHRPRRRLPRARPALVERLQSIGVKLGSWNGNQCRTKSAQLELSPSTRHASYVQTRISGHIEKVFADAPISTCARPATLHDS